MFVLHNDQVERPETRSERRQAMTKVETETGKMIAALMDGLQTAPHQIRRWLTMFSESMFE